MSGFLRRGDVCAVGDCDAAVHSRGWCQRHYLRWWKHGDPLTLAAKGPKGPRAADVGYVAAHDRVRSARGLASDFGCSGAGCDRQSRDWAYVSGSESDDQARTDELGRKFSLDVSRYVPLCRPCHKGMDALGVFGSGGRGEG